jgi:aminodeoxyfutalosine deaminase
MVPKAELHIHLEGSIDPETLLELDPSLTREEIAEATSYADFAGFLRSYIWVNRRLRSPQDYAIAARRLFERQAGEGVTYTEVTLSVGVILWKEQSFPLIYEALQREAGRAKLQVRWIIDAIRQFGAEPAKPVFELAAERVNDGVVAIGIGGAEDRGPATWFADLYREARDCGLRLTCHAGETTDPQSVWDALAIGAERIGHGIRSIQDPALMQHLREKNIPLEICVTSNLRTAAIASLAEHPIRKLYDTGVPMVLNSDDPALFGCTLASEYELAAREFGFTEQELARLAEDSFRYAFDLEA